jgi:hypothetical protein
MCELHTGIFSIEHPRPQSAPSSVSVAKGLRCCLLDLTLYCLLTHVHKLALGSSCLRLWIKCGFIIGPPKLGRE